MLLYNTTTKINISQKYFQLEGGNMDNEPKTLVDEIKNMFDKYLGEHVISTTKTEKNYDSLEAYLKPEYSKGIEETMLFEGRVSHLKELRMLQSFFIIYKNNKLESTPGYAGLSNLMTGLVTAVGIDY